MSISRRTTVAVRTLGVAAAASALSLGFAGSAFACSIHDFSGSAACDSSNGTATITVTDDDSTGHTADLQLSYGGTQIGGTKTVVGNAQTPGQAVFTDVPWETSGSWTVTVSVSGVRLGGSTIQVPTSGAACAAPTTSAPATPPTASSSASAPTSAAPSASASAASSGTASAPPAPSSSAAAGGSASAAPVSAASASPTGPALAETGGGNDSGLIAGIAGALVIAGGGVVFALRRRSAAGRH